jgi:hypothetical protein
MQPNFEPHSSTPEPSSPGRPDMPPPVPNPLRQDHSMPVGEQLSVDVNNLPKNAGNNLFQASGNSSANSDYDFILNPAPPTHPAIKNSLLHGTLARVVMGLIGVFVIIIVIAVIASLSKGSSNLPYFESVLEDQQELIHITTNAVNEPDISSSNQNFVSTASTSLNSNSTQLESYLATSGVKISTSVLSLKVSSTIDNDLTNAESSGSFNSTFDQVAKADLNGYMEDLKLAYSKTTGPQGRALLSSFYNQAGLLIVSLDNGS